MSKKNKELLERYEALLDALKSSYQNEQNYYLPAGRQYLKTLSALNTACAKANVDIIENEYWNKYGRQISGREVALDDIPAVVGAIFEIIDELKNGGKVKRDYAGTKRGDVIVARSAIGTQFEYFHGRGSKRDQAERIAEWLSKR